MEEWVSRPGAEIITEEEELKRVLPHVQNIINKFPEAVLSIDTIRESSRRMFKGAGAHIINDISAGRFDEAMVTTVAKHKAPYIIMHMQGLPNNMQQNPQYQT